MMSTAVAVETPASAPQRPIPWTAVVVAACLALAHVPIVWSYVAALIELPHYGFVLLLPIGAAVLAWPRLRTLGTLKPGGALGFFAWLTPAVLGLLVAMVLESPWFGTISALFACMAVAYGVGGTRLATALTSAWIVLWMGVRLPLTADQTLAQWLQQVAAERASVILNTIGELHLLDGNVVETAAKRYMVEEACSGVQSLFAITACTVFFALWMRESWWRALLLLAAAWWWVWVANVARVVLVTYVNSTWGIPVDEGWMHEALGIVLFLVTLGLIISTEHLLLFFLPRGIFSRGEKALDPSFDPQALPDYGPTAWPEVSATRLASIPLAVVYGLLIVVQWLPHLRVPAASATPVNLEATLVKEFAPAEFEGWVLKSDADKGFESVQRRSDSQWGARSQTWRYRKGTQELTVSVDYPFRGWHELTICYEADGWLRQTRDVIDVPPPPAGESVVKPGEKCVRSLFHRPEISAYGFLLFESFNDRQDPIPVPKGGRDVVQKLRDRLDAFVERVTTLGASGSGVNDQTQSYQLQVFLQGFVPSTEAERAEAGRLYGEFRARLARGLPGQGGKP